MADIAVKLTYTLVEQRPEQKREHMCSGCVFRSQPCIDLLPAGAHCSEGTIYIRSKREWLS